MAPPEICFLFNTRSNSGLSLRRERSIREQVEQRWPGAEFILTEPENRFWDSLTEQLAGVTTIVACGGDGTVHKAGNLAIRLNATLGVIPIGSGNDFAHMMNIPKSVPAALDFLTLPNRRTIDVLKIQGDVECFCLNTAGIGLDGMANHFTNRYKKTIGKAGYLAGSIKAILVNHAAGLQITVDGVTSTDRYLMVTACNGQREGGSFRVAPDASPDDGLIDLLLIRPMATPALLLALPLFLTLGSESLINRERCSCKKVGLKWEEPMFIHIDGEYSEKKIQAVTIEMVESALKVIA